MKLLESLEEMIYDIPQENLLPQLTEEEKKQMIQNQFSASSIEEDNRTANISELKSSSELKKIGSGREICDANEEETRDVPQKHLHALPTRWQCKVDDDNHTTSSQPVMSEQIRFNQLLKQNRDLAQRIQEEMRRQRHDGIHNATGLDGLYRQDGGTFSTYNASLNQPTQQSIQNPMMQPLRQPIYQPTTQDHLGSASNYQKYSRHMPLQIFPPRFVGKMVILHLLSFLFLECCSLLIVIKVLNCLNEFSPIAFECVYSC